MDNLNHAHAQDTALSLDSLLGRERARVFMALLRLQLATAAQLAESLELTPNTVRRHLKRLEQARLVIHTARRLPKGRPVFLFQLSQYAARLLPAAREPLLALGECALADLNEDDRDRIARVLFDRLLQRPVPIPRNQLPDLAARLRSAGFLCHADEEGPRLCIDSCPLGRLPHAFPALCAAERDIIERVLGRKVVRTSWRVEGDRDCCYRITDEPSRE